MGCGRAPCAHAKPQRTQRASTCSESCNDALATHQHVLVHSVLAFGKVDQEVTALLCARIKARATTQSQAHNTSTHTDNTSAYKVRYCHERRAQRVAAKHSARVRGQHVVPRGCAWMRQHICDRPAPPLACRANRCRHSAGNGASCTQRTLLSLVVGALHLVPTAHAFSCGGHCTGSCSRACAGCWRPVPTRPRCRPGVARNVKHFVTLCVHASRVGGRVRVRGGWRAAVQSERVGAA